MAEGDSHVKATQPHHSCKFGGDLIVTVVDGTQVDELWAQILTPILTPRADLEAVQEESAVRMESKAG